MAEGKFNSAWQKIFSELAIRDKLEKDGVFHITTEQIKSHGKNEPRLMCKWDSRASRPKILADNHVTILPVSRKEYVLLRGDGYQDLPRSGPATFYPPDKLYGYESLGWREDMHGEPEATDTAFLASMLSTFTEEPGLALTIRGKGGSSSFSFRFNCDAAVQDVNVSKAIIEIDSGYEGDKIWLIEAKARVVNDFIIRQLYFPWRLWQSKSKKPVASLLLTYTNRVFGLYEYKFDETDEYHSIRLKRSASYTFDRPESIPDIPSIFDKTKPRKSPLEIPFPQADTLGLVIDTISFCESEPKDTVQVAEQFEIDARQGDYYCNAAAWLGFLEREGTKFHATDLGRKFSQGNRFQRFEMLFSQIASLPVFRNAVKFRMEGKNMSDDQIAEQISRCGYNETTSQRRVKTVISWINWLWSEHTRLTAEAS